MPVTPHRPAGWRIEPPVSVPIDSGAMPRRHAGRRAAAGAAGDARRGPTGCASSWKAEFSVEPPMANSSMFVLPISTASAAFSLAMTVASYGGRKSSSIREPQVVGSPCGAEHVLDATGSPAKRPERLARPGGAGRSPRPARARRRIDAQETPGPCASCRSMRSRYARVSSTDVTSPDEAGPATAWPLDRSSDMVENRDR